MSLNQQCGRIEQLVVVDNGSHDHTVEVVERACHLLSVEVTIVRSTNTGFAGGYETAAKHIRNVSLPTLCVNPDVVLREGSVPKLLEAIETWPSIGIATLPLFDGSGEDSACRRVLPTIGAAALYAVFRNFVPRPVRYNSRKNSIAGAIRWLLDGTRVTPLEATTGALMLVAPTFRSVERPIFDTDYWMYGEDLQLCHDAKTESFEVVMVEDSHSFHNKGTSSGWPRSRRSNIAFHNAMVTYYRKNLRRSRLEALIVLSGIWGRQMVSLALASIVRACRSN